MSTALQDLRFAVRGLIKQRGFTLVAVLTLGLGIGANSAIFGIVNAVLLRPLPYQDPDRVVLLWSHWTNWAKTWVSQGELVDYQQQARSLEHVGAFSTASFNLTGSGDPLRVRAALVQPEVFAALGAQPLTGRVFTADEDRSGHEHVVMLTEGLWRSAFGSDPAIVGRAIQLDAEPYIVVGVLPAALRLPIDYASRTLTQVWVPLALGPNDPQARGNHGLFALGRLRPGIALTQAQAEIDTITHGFLQRFPNFYDKEFGLTLVTAPREVFGGVRPALELLLLAVGAVLLIACANVANLLLARSDARRKELAIRVVLGAGRGRIVRQLLTESMVLSAIGGVAGVTLAYGLTRALIALDPLKIPRVQDIAIDGRVLAFTAAISAITGLLFGIVPAIQSSRADLQPLLKEGGRDAPVVTGWLRRVLVAGEVAASVVLVAAALLLARSFARLLDVDAGFNPSHVLTLRTSLPNARYADMPAMVKAYVELGRRLRESPGVQSAGAVTGLPLASTRGDWGIQIEGRVAAPGERSIAADWQVVTPGYFEAIGVPLREGRTVTGADRADTQPVIVVNESMARKYWPAGSPIGRRMKMGGPATPWLTVVGVVADVHHRGLDEVPRPEMYRPHAQYPYPQPALTWVLRTAGDPRSAIGQARAAIAAVDSSLGVSDVATLEQVMSDSTSDRRLNMLLFALLGGLALALAAVGVYGVVAYSVTQRTHEIGVRMAIGARPTDVVRMVLAEGGRLAMAGVAAGSVAAIAGARLIRGLLFDVSATDPLTYAAVALGLLAVALLASYIPARRATRVDPMIALRGE
ncbi:MAG TPA: ABC transporter permease [Vicinamibacterales bacterium]|nr:ABC transporter permease [Vicinamibacterales bacterium]